MAINNQRECLHVPIKNLPFSNEFISFVNSLHIETLDEMLQVDLSDLIKKPGFTYHVLQELVQFLEKENLAGLLKQ